MLVQKAIKTFKIHLQVNTWAEPVLISEKWAGMYLISCFLKLATSCNLHSSRFPPLSKSSSLTLCSKSILKHLMKHVDILQSESHKCFRTLLVFVGLSFLTYVIMCFQEWHLIISELVSWYFILAWKPAPHIQDCHLTFSGQNTSLFCGHS